MQLLPLNSSFR